MDRDERTAHLERAIRVANESQMRELMVIMPVKVVSYSANDQPATAKLQPTIQIKRQMPDGSVVNQSLPEIPRAPVHFMTGGGYAFTHPINAGDEGYIVVSSRSIEGWMQRGDVQPQAHVHYHELTDAIFIPGLRSKPRALSNISTNSVQLRSEDGRAVFDFTSNQLTISFPGGGQFVFKNDGTFTATGNVVAGQGGSDQVALQTHRHTNVQSGPSQSGPPAPGT